MSRVELAASELARSDATPRVQRMLDTISEAVGEIDGLLGAIGLLSSPVARPEAPRADWAAVCERVVLRLEPAHRARGIELRAEGAIAGLRCAIPEPTLERLVLVFLRLGLVSAERGDALRLVARAEDSAIELRLEADAGQAWRPRPERAPELRLEVETQLVEWGGSLDGDAEAGWIGIRLPGARGDD